MYLVKEKILCDKKYFLKNASLNPQLSKLIKQEKIGFIKESSICYVGNMTLMYLDDHPPEYFQKAKENWNEFYGTNMDYEYSKPSKEEIKRYKLYRKLCRL